MSGLHGVLGVRGVRGMLGVLGMLVLLGAAQAPRGDGIITGQVVDGATGKPIGAAIVSVNTPVFGGRIGPGSGAPPRILTAGDGRFVFKDLPAGSFTVTVTKGGYADGASGRRRPGGASQPIELNDARKNADVAVRIWKNGAIAGTVTDEAGEPVVGVMVRALSRTAVGGRKSITPAREQASTDDRGAYRISNLVPGEYVLMTNQPPISLRASVYADVARTGRGSGAIPIPIGPNAAALITMDDMVLAISRGGAIPPPPVGGRLRIYPTTYYPSSLGPAQATGITLASGEERMGADIQLQPVPVSRVSGTLLSPAGPVGGAMVTLISPAVGQMPNALQASGAVTDASGAFVFGAVTAGQYKLLATSGGGQGELYWADFPLAVGGDDVDNLVVVMNPSLNVSARMEFNGSSSKPDGLRGRFVPFALEPVDARNPGAPLGRGTTISSDSFTLHGLQPGQYLVRITNSPQGWMFRSAMLDGVDVSETPFELTRTTGEIVVTFTDRWSGMSGTVHGTGSDTAAVIVFPTDAQKWDTPASSPRRLRLARTNAKGDYGISSLPPGDYFVVAIPDDDSDDWRDGARLEALARLAAQITILEGEHKTVDLQIREVRR